MKFGLSDTTIEKIFRVLANYPQVEKAILYGSRAKGNYRPGSDIDLTLVGSGELTRHLIYKILNDIDDLDLPYMFDISNYDQLHNTALIDHINRIGIVIYEKERNSAPILTE